jgi:hypothetical protein
MGAAGREIGKHQEADAVAIVAGRNDVLCQRRQLAAERTCCNALA